jgi:hypothetical protein
MTRLEKIRSYFGALVREAVHAAPRLDATLRARR